MIIHHTEKHRWIKEIDPSIFPDFGKNNSKKIQSLLKDISTTTITHSFELLTTEHISWFEKLYNANLATKHNPRPYDVYGTTLGKDIIIHPYHILILYEAGVPIGGTIFTLRKERLSMVYRTYPSDWSLHSFKCSPALYAEYIATEHALANKLPFLVHGVDLNPYGVHSNVGVAIFKLSTGCHPEIKPSYSIHETDLNTLPYNSLILEAPVAGNKIIQGYIIGNEETAQKYEQLFKYSDQLQVTLYTPTL
ncbi:MAG: hypothetical protein V4606_00940 [Patescibacteria group bacterium]